LILERGQIHTNSIWSGKVLIIRQVNYKGIIILPPVHKKRAVGILERQIDTFWTPGPNPETIQEKSFSATPAVV